MSDAANKQQQQQQQPQGAVVEQGVQQIQVQMSHDGQQAGTQHAVVGVPQQAGQHHQQAGGVAVVPASGMAQQLQQQQQVAVSMQQQTMQSPPAIAPAPMQPPPSQAATTTITTMSTLHPPLQHPMPPPTPQTLAQHAGVPHSQLQQVNDWGHGRVQVIQQPLQNPTYLQQLYNTQGQLLMPGNLQLHPAGMNPSSIHVITAGKPFQPNQIPPQMITTQKSVLQGQPASFPGYAAIPTTTNQTLVISQLGVISNPQNILPAHSAAGAKPTDMQKVMGSKTVGGSGSSMKGGAGPQQSSGYVVSQPQQLITTQTPTTAMLGTGQATQFISPIQYTTCGGGRAVQQNSQPMQFSPWQFGGPSLPQGITWATASGGLQPPTLLTTQNPIFIRSQQDGTGMFIQSPPPQLQSHNPTLTATPTAMPSVQQMTGKPRPTMEIQANIQPKAAVPRALSNILPSMSTANNNIRPASSVSTQTGGSTQVNAAQVQTQKTQAKVRSKPAMSRTSPAPGAQKADAANQTKPQSGSPAAQQPQQLVASTTSTTKMIVTNVSSGVTGTTMTSVGSPVSAEKAQQTMIAQANTAKTLATQQQQQVAMQQQQQPQMTVQQQQINMQQQQMQQMQHFQQQLQQQQLQPQLQPQQVPQQQSPQPQQLQPQMQQQPQQQVQQQMQPQPQAQQQQVQAQQQQQQQQQQVQQQQQQVQQQQVQQQVQQKPVIGIAVVSQQQQQLTSQHEQRPLPTMAASCPPVHSATSPGPVSVATPPPPSPVPALPPAAPSPQAVPSPPLAAAQATQTTKDDAMGDKPGEEPPQDAVVHMEVEECAEPEAASEVAKDKAVGGALVENSNSTPDDGKVEKERDKGLPKALVKPHILTHVIDGFVIREGDPFPSRATVHSELVQISKSANHQLPSNERKSYTDPDEPPKKKQSVDAGPNSPPGPKGELAKCEFCGKMDVRSRFRKSSKRFCSVACSKSKRVGMYKPATSNSSNNNNSTSNNNNNTVSVNNNNISLDVSQPDSKDLQRQKSLGKKDVVPGQSQAMAATDENTDTNDSAASGAESSLSPSEAPEVPPVDMEDSSAESVLSSAQPKINPLKWTVSEVCEFIRTLPGCSDYVDDFAIQEIDGQALMLLKEDHLMQAMSMKLGPALKIVAKIDTMRGDKDK